jgi:hypothetical protein
MADPYAPKKIETSSSASPSSFWPLTLLGLSLCAVLLWQLIVSNQVRQRETQLRDQQVKSVEQARRVEGGLQKFARDLLEVAKTDQEAQALVKKYNISLINPAPAAAPAASPQASP